MIRINRTILKSTELGSEDVDGKSASEFQAQGVVRVWVRGAGGTFPASETVTLQEWVDFDGVSGAWADDPSTDAAWTAEDKKFLALCSGRRYRLLASAVGFVARADTYSDNSELVV